MVNYFIIMTITLVHRSVSRESTSNKAKAILLLIALRRIRARQEQKEILIAIVKFTGGGSKFLHSSNIVNIYKLEFYCRFVFSIIIFY